MAGIGKNVIENLTIGMYDNSYTIYREYIQNAADSIDKAIEDGLILAQEANIDIAVDDKKRTIKIYDNAMGISKEKFYKILSDIADSEKDRTKNKGFRGIGRLAGLAYCKTLIFRTSFLGENVISIMEWDGELLQKILVDKNQHPSASELIDKLITCKEEKGDKEDHFFEVILKDINLENEELLNVNKVINYLEEVSPIQYQNHFIFSQKIYDFIKEHNLKLNEYQILVNGKEIFKPYRTVLYEGTREKNIKYDEIKDIAFRKINSKNGKLMGWMWFGISEYDRQIPIINKMRGIRLRKENIQIGNENTLTSKNFFKESRGNTYFVGEVFVIDSDLIPNARRDYFNPNLTLREFEEAIKPILYKELYELYHYASKVKSAFKKINEYKQKEEEYKTKIQNAGFSGKQEEENLKKELKDDEDKIKKATKELELREKEINKTEIKNEIKDRIYKTLEKKYKEKLLQEITRPDISENKNLEDNVKKKEKKYLTQSLSKYNKQERKLISEIYSIINSMLPKDMSSLVIKKIQEELSK